MTNEDREEVRQIVQSVLQQEGVAIDDNTVFPMKNSAGQDDALLMMQLDQQHQATEYSRIESEKLGGGGEPITIDPQPTKDSPNAVSSGGTFGALQQLNEINATLSDDGKIYNNFFAGDIYYIEQDTGVRVYWVAFADGEASVENPVTISALNFYRAENAVDAVRMSLSTKTVTIDAYTKQESDAKYQPKGNYQPAGNYATKTELNGKVDNVSGKGLSTNDYTNEDKAKVAAAITEHQDISGKANKSEVVAEKNRAEAAEEQLRTLYEAVNKDDIIPVAAGDWPLSNLQENVVYRVAGTTSFTDYMYDGTNTIPMATHTYGDDITTQLTEDEIIGSKFIYKNGQLANGYSSFSILKFDISSLAGIIHLNTESPDNTSVYAYTIHDANGNALSYPSDSENVTVKREFKIDLSTLNGYKYLYVAAPGEAFNIIKGEISVLSEEVQNLSDDVKAMESEVNISIPKTYSDAIRLNLLLNPTYNTFVICANGGAFYKIDKGTKVNIIAKSNQDAACAFLNTVPAEVEGTQADYMTGESLHIIAMGTTSSFVAPDDGYIYIQAVVWGTNTFPESVVFAVNGIKYLSNELTEQNDTPEKNRLFVNGLTFRYKDLEKVSEGTITDGYIFNAAHSGFITTDFIEIESYTINPYCIFLEAMGSSFKVIEFYDKDKNVIATVTGVGPTGNGNDFNRKILKVNFPNGCKYIRYARYRNYSNLGLFKAKVVNMEDITNEFVQHSVFTDTNNILWLGTSIPEGAQYPIEASTKCGYNCINKAHGSSCICALSQHPVSLNYATGRRLSMTVDEIEAMFRDDVTAGNITEEKLTEWKNDSYEVRILPYINGTNATQVSMIVFDHGFNDRETIHNQMQNVQSIDWNSTDRTTFTGAFRYLLNEITKINPFIKIVIAGYFQNTYMHTDYYADEICKMQELIAKHYSISIMKAWEHSQINGSYVAGTSNYLAEFNAQYGTSYTAYSTDNNGNILSMQLYCPDMVHPHSDRSGNCDKRLNAVYSKLLADLI